MTTIFTVFFAITSLIALTAAAHLALWTAYKPEVVARLNDPGRTSKLKAGVYLVACALGWGAVIGCGLYQVLWWLPGSIGSLSLREHAAVIAGLMAGAGMPSFFFTQAAKTPIQ